MAKKVANHREDALYSQIASILEQNRKSVAVAVNTAMVRTYYEIGRSIVENEQKGNIRAEYGKEVLKNLSARLTANYGKGFSTTNLKQMRDFYLTYQIGQTVSDQFVLSWSHYLFLMRIDNPDERKFYEIEAKNSNWSLRELKRQFDSALYERLAVSKDKESVRELSKKGCIVESPADIVKDPYILEFLGLPEQSEYSETELESKLFLGPEVDEYSVKFSLDGLMRGNTKARSDYYHGAILDGYMTPNEVRTLEGLERKEGLDFFLRPLNSEVVGQEDIEPNK